MHASYLNEKNALAIISQYDIVADCSDNFATKYLINDACITLHKPNVVASINQFQGQLMVFSQKGKPCYRCLFANNDSKFIPNCAEAGVIGCVTGVMGTLQANEIVKLILSIGEPLLNQLLLVNLLHLSFKKLQMTVDVTCDCCVKRHDFQLLERPMMHWEFALTQAKFDLLKKRFKDNLYLIDVRTPEEYAKGSFNARMINIPLIKLDQAIKHFDRRNIFVCYCQSGIRSIKACQKLYRAGLTAYYLERQMFIETTD